MASSDFPTDADMVILIRRIATRLLVIVGLLSLALTTQAETIKDETIGFVLELPTHYKPIASTKHSPDRQKYVFESTTKPKMVLSIRGLGLTVPQVRDTSELMGKDGFLGDSPADWNGLKLDVIRGRDEDDKEVRTYWVIVPLATEAILLGLSSRDADDKEIQVEIQNILKRLQGPTDWKAMGNEKRTTIKSPQWLGFVVTALFLSGLIWGVTRSKGPMVMSVVALAVAVSGIVWEKFIPMAPSSPWPRAFALGGGLALLLSGYGWYQLWNHSRSARRFLADSH